jgi:hypothetical protein
LGIGAGAGVELGDVVIVPFTTVPLQPLTWPLHAVRQRSRLNSDSRGLQRVGHGSHAATCVSHVTGAQLTVVAQHALR